MGDKASSDWPIAFENVGCAFLIAWVIVVFLGGC